MMSLEDHLLTLLNLQMASKLVVVCVCVYCLLCAYSEAFVCLSDAVVDGTKKVYGCALPPGYGSDDSQVVPCL